MSKRTKKIVMLFAPIFLGVLIFIILLYTSKIEFLRKQQRTISNLSFKDTHTSNILKLNNIKNRKKIVTFFWGFDPGCMAKRINLLNSIASSSNDNINEIKIICIFCPDFSLQDVKNYKNIFDLEFDCVIPTNESIQQIVQLGIKKNPYTIIVNEENSIIYYDHKKKNSDFVSYIESYFNIKNEDLLNL